MAGEPSADRSWLGSGSGSHEPRRPHHIVSSLGAVGPRAARRTRGLDTRKTLVVAHRTRSAPRGAAPPAARRPGSCFPLHATEQTPPQGRRIDGVGANVLYHTTWAALPAGTSLRHEITPGRTHVVESRRRTRTSASCFGFET